MEFITIGDTGGVNIELPGLNACENKTASNEHYEAITTTPFSLVFIILDILIMLDQTQLAEGEGRVMLPVRPSY